MGPTLLSEEKASQKVRGVECEFFFWGVDLGCTKPRPKGELDLNPMESISMHRCPIGDRHWLGEGTENVYAGVFFWKLL